MKFKKGDRVRVYGEISGTQYYSYDGVSGTVNSVESTCLWVIFDGSDPRLSHCRIGDQVHKKQCRRLIKRKKSGAV